MKEVNRKKENAEDKKDKIKQQFVDHVDETILLDIVKYEGEVDNIHHELTILEQTILLALCLDMKNDNAMNGLNVSCSSTMIGWYRPFQIIAVSVKYIKERREWSALTSKKHQDSLNKEGKYLQIDFFQ